MFIVYVLRSLKDHRFYIGLTADLISRLKKHHQGGVPSTKHRRPLVLVHKETCETRLEARKREKFLKSGAGHRFLNEIIAARNIESSPRVAEVAELVDALDSKSSTA